MKKLLLLSIGTLFIFNPATPAMDSKQSIPRNTLAQAIAPKNASTTYAACLTEANKRLVKISESQNMSPAEAQKENQKFMWELEFCKSIDFGSPKTNKGWFSSPEENPTPR